MVIAVRISIDSKEVERQLAAHARQIPFATARALTATARQAVTDVRSSMQSVFDRPTPFTLNAFYAKPATKADLSATVESRDYAPKGRPAIKYLMPEIEGGSRVLKGFEKALEPFSQGRNVMPGSGAKLDAYGNQSRGEIVRVLSRLNALADPLQNRSDRTTKRLRRQKKTVAASQHRSEYFIARGRSGEPLGIYQLVGRGQVKPIMIFARQPTYRAVLNVTSIIAKSASLHGPQLVDEAIAEALRTAR